MPVYAGLDVSDKATHICVVGGDGAVVRRDAVASDPGVLAAWLTRHCPDLARVVLETGPLSTFLYHGLVEQGDGDSALIPVPSHDKRPPNQLILLCFGVSKPSGAALSHLKST